MKRSFKERMMNKQKKDATRKPKGAGGNYLQYFDYKAVGIEKFKLIGEEEYTVNFLPFPVESDKHPLYKELVKEWGTDEDLIDYKIPYHIHRVKDPEGNTHKFLCPNKTYGKPCPFCEEQRRLNNEPGGYEAHKEEINAVKPSAREMYVVQDVEDGKVYLLDQSDWFFGKNLRKKMERKKGVGTILLANPDDDGHEVGFYVQRSSLNKTDKDDKWIPGECTDFEFEERGEAIPDEVLDSVPAIDAGLVLYSYDEIASFLDGSYFIQSDDDDDEEEDEPEDDDEDIEEEEEEDETPPDPPKKERRRRERKKPEPKECPEGLEYGADWDTDDACDNCSLFDQCEEAYRASEK